MDTPQDLFARRVAVERVVDGDTFVGTVDLGYHASVRGITYRLARVNCPERGQPGHAAAKAWTALWLEAHAAGMVVVSTQTDNWRRYIAEVWSADGENLSDALAAAGHAVLWEKKRPTKGSVTG